MVDKRFAMKNSTSLLFAFLAALFVVSAAPPAAAADKVKLSLAATNDPAYLPFFVAIDKGYYRQLGLDVEPVYVGGGVATPGLISGAIQFSTSTGSAISAILKGAKIKVVMTLSESPPWRLWVTDPGIKSLADLKGKPVGIQSHGDLFEMSMRNLLLKNGMEASAVTYVQLGYGSGPRLAVIKTHSLPAVLLTNLEERIARERGLLGDARMLADISETIRTPNNGLAVSDAMLAEKPDVVERMVRGTLMAVRYIKTQRAGALAVFAKHAKGVAPDVLRGALDEQAEKFLDGGEASLDAWQAELTVRASIVGLKEAPPPQSAFDYAPVKKAAQKLTASGWKAAP